MRKSFLLLLIALLAAMRAEANDAACQADIGGNGIVDFADLLLFTEHYGETCAKTVDADSLAAVTALRDSISALQTALASETERANENKRLLTASNAAFNSLSQTRCPEPEPVAQPLPEPPVVIEPPTPTEPPPPTPSLSVLTALRDSISALQTALASETERANENKRLLTASNAAYNSLVTSLRDSISTLQAALGAARFAVTTLQTALASETKRANENKRLLTASNAAFNSLSQTRCPEPEPPAPAPEPEPPAQPEPPASVPRFEQGAKSRRVIDSRYNNLTVPEDSTAMSLEKTIRADGDGWVVDLRISFKNTFGRTTRGISLYRTALTLPGSILRARYKAGSDTWRTLERYDTTSFSLWLSNPIQIEGFVVEIQFRVPSDEVQRHSRLRGNISLGVSLIDVKRTYFFDEMFFMIFSND